MLKQVENIEHYANKGKEEQRVVDNTWGGEAELVNRKIEVFKHVDSFTISSRHHKKKQFMRESDPDLQLRISGSGFCQKHVEFYCPWEVFKTHFKRNFVSFK